MIEIFITKNKIALVDDEDFEELNKFSWQILWSKTSNTFIKYYGEFART